jgi:hypothetical protein
MVTFDSTLHAQLCGLCVFLSVIFVVKSVGMEQTHG